MARGLRIGVVLNNGILPAMHCGHCSFAGNLREKSLATIKTEGTSALTASMIISGMFTYVSCNVQDAKV